MRLRISALGIVSHSECDSADGMSGYEWEMGSVVIESGRTLVHNTEFAPSRKRSTS